MQDFATGFAFSGAPASGVGPIGVTLDAGGSLLAGDAEDGFVYRFGVGGGIADASHRVNASPIAGSLTGSAFGKDGRLYVARSSGDVVEIDPSTGAIVRTVVNGVPEVRALAVDPLSGDLFLTYAGSPLVRIANPASTSPVMSVYAPMHDPDGLTIGPDGTMYVVDFVGPSGPSVVRVAGTDAALPGATAAVAVVPSADGVAVGANPVDHTKPPFLAVNRNDGKITLIDLTQSPVTQSEIVTGGSRGDFATVGPDGCLYATQTDRVLKVTASDGRCPFGHRFEPVSAFRPPTVVTTPAAGVGADAATLTGTVNPNGTAAGRHFEYGPSSGYGQVTADLPLPASTAAQAVSAAVAGLATCAPYHYRIVAESSAGTSFGQDQTFTTLCARPPVVASPCPGSASTGPDPKATPGVPPPATCTGFVAPTAIQVEPILHVDANDGFFPVSFHWVYDFVGTSNYNGNLFSDELQRSRRDIYTCIGPKNHGCRGRARPPLTAANGAGQILDFPEPVTDRAAQQALEFRTIRSATGRNPQKNPTVYVFRTDFPGGGFVRQYWYWYTYNYFDAAGLPAAASDLHEGDWEHVDITFDSGRVPYMVFLSQHSGGQALPYHAQPGSADHIALHGYHPLVWAAHGDHANYPRCGSFSIRPAIHDTTCETTQQGVGRSARVVNLAARNQAGRFACWQGRAGSDYGVGAAPFMPLRQGGYDAEKRSVCGAAQATSTAAVGRGSTATAPAVGGGPSDLRLCSTYERPPADVAIRLVVCDQGVLTRFYASGLTNLGPERIRIVDSRAPAAMPSVPDFTTFSSFEQLGQATVTADRATRPDVYVAKTYPDGTTAIATFSAVAVTPGQPLRVVAGDSGPWSLVAADGAAVATVAPVRTTVPPRPLAVSATRAGGTVAVSWRVRAQPADGTFTIDAARGRRLIPVAIVARHASRHYVVRLRAGRLRAPAVVIVGRSSGGEARSTLIRVRPAGLRRR